MTKLLIIGAKGQLASELHFLKDQYTQFEYRFTPHSETDISVKKAVESIVNEYLPDYIINCAAYTAVDKAESDIENCYAVNEIGVRNLAEISKKNQVFLIHISTDCVFDGEKKGAYLESDITNPLSVYGKSKEKGEQAIQEINGDYLIIRTSWVYSSFGHNFVKTMMRYGAERESLSVVNDQIGSPTYCRDLANFILSHIEVFHNHSKQIYHFANEGCISWFDFAVEIMKLNNLPCIVHPIPTTSYPTPATRPKNCFLDKTKVKEDFNIEIPDWKLSLEKCIRLIQN